MKKDWSGNPIYSSKELDSIARRKLGIKGSLVDKINSTGGYMAGGFLTNALLAGLLSGGGIVGGKLLAERYGWDPKISMAAGGGLGAGLGMLTPAIIGKLCARGAKKEDARDLYNNLSGPKYLIPGYDAYANAVLTNGLRDVGVKGSVMFPVAGTEVQVPL